MVSFDRSQAMNWVKRTISDLQFPGVSFAISNSYSRWEIDDVSLRETSNWGQSNTTIESVVTPRERMFRWAEKVPARLYSIIRLVAAY